MDDLGEDTVVVADDENAEDFFGVGEGDEEVNLGSDDEEDGDEDEDDDDDDSEEERQQEQQQ